MNAYTTKGQAGIRLSEMTILGTDMHLAGASLAAFDRQRRWQVEAETGWLLKQHSVTPHPFASLVSVLRQTIGAALVRAGERLSGAPARGASPGMTPEAGTLQTGV